MPQENDNVKIVDIGCKMKTSYALSENVDNIFKKAHTETP